MRSSSIPAPLSRAPSGPQPAATPTGSTVPERIGERYRVQAVLGRGGMAVVYRVTDGEGGRELALKQLLVSETPTNYATILPLFEQEFRTLAELTHPRVIRVYDYGWDPSGAYYTMELLDGGGLIDCAPLPWREACALIHDVCSSLSLLHVRRLVHRDVSPHNVRRTQNGRAKLIDFGAMAPMGPSEQVIGTPAFTAPEVTLRLTLDARTDLFSLGATLYFALTGRLAYAARSFAQLSEAWANQPALPSESCSDVPAQLDTLVMSMLSLEPALRPRSASEVMLQLATLVGHTDAEHSDVSRAYLSTPSLVGRDQLMLKFKRRATRARTRAGSGLVIQGVAGSGRTRALEACTLLAQTHGAVVTRISASAAGLQPFAAAQLLTDQLAQALPELCGAVAREAKISEVLFDTTSALTTDPVAGRTLRPRALSYGSAERGKLRDALTQLWLQIARHRVLLIAVDDVERLDEPSSAWLATLAAQLKKNRLLLVCTATLASREAHPALKVIAEHSAHYDLSPLKVEHVAQLLLSAFGDVPHVALLSDRISRVANGSPRACMELARYLIDRGTIHYEGGTWMMPTQLEMSDLPASLDEALAARLAALSPQACRLADLLALSIYGGLARVDCEQLVDLRHASLDLTISELLEHDVITRSGDVHEIANEAWASALGRACSDEQRAERHRVLGELGLRTGRAEVASAYHLFHAGLAARAFELLRPLMRADATWGIESLSEATMPRDLICKVLSWNLSHAESQARSPRELADIRRWLCMLSMGSEDEYYRIAAPGLLTTLRHDSGLDDCYELVHIADAGQRLGAALQRAAERYAATPEVARAYDVQDAIKYLVQFVVASIAIGTRSFDAQTLATLPGLLEPFSVLSPVIDAIHQNTLATRECMIEGRYHQARVRWQEVYDRLGQVPRDELHYVDMIRSAILYGLGALEAARGLPSASERAELLDKDPMQMVNAMYLRRVMRLQAGDFDGAERFRRQAELLAVQSNSRQMFTTILLVELAAYGTARDLTAIREISARITSLAERSPGWFVYQLASEGCGQFLRGDLRSAAESLEAALARCWPDANDPQRSTSAMPVVSAMYLEVLFALEAYEQAKEFGLRALAEAARVDILTVDEMERGLALAEAKLGDTASAVARLDALIARQQAHGVAGLLLGTNYEARARVAIWNGDQAAFYENSKLAALHYRHGRGSPLGARYEQLISEARQRGVLMSRELSEFETSTLGSTRLGTRGSARTLLKFSVRAATNADERAAAIVRMLAEASAAQVAHLFLVEAGGTVRWAASHSDQPHGDSELALARLCLERALNDDFGSTQVESELDSSSIHSSAILTGAGGIAQHVQLLTGSPNGESRYVGVVVSTAVGSRPANHPLLAAVAEYFVAIGDTEGMPM